MVLDDLLNKRNDIDYVKSLTQEDIKILINLLEEKNDEIRYAAFLALQERSKHYNDVYNYFDVLTEKLKNDNSYQRSIGLMLIAENIRWDKNNKLKLIIDDYLSHCNDEKFITSRQTIQSILIWISEKPEYYDKVFEKLNSIDILSLKDTQRKSILTDIINVLIAIYENNKNSKIIEYILNAFNSGILDNKTIKLFDKKLNIN
jgi:hypothetical protein